jgi:hypothetical protein
VTQTGSARTNSRRRSTASSRNPAWDQVQAAGQRTGQVVRKGGGPALAAGATLAGVAAGFALGARKGNGLGGLRPLTHRGGARDVLRAARGVEAAACQAGDLARELRLLRRASLEAQKRSPIEVVLQALTRRPSP